MRSDEILAQARGPLGEQRFYPPYQHPACARLVAHLEEIKSLEKQPGIDETQLAQLKAYALEQLALFEWGENLAKLAYLEMKRRPMRREPL